MHLEHLIVCSIDMYIKTTYMENTCTCLQYWDKYEPLRKHPVKRIENLESNCEPIKLLLFTLEMNTEIF